MKRVFTRQRTN